MEFEPNNGKKWLQSVVDSLPRLDEILRNNSSETLIIGAAVFDIYFAQGWVPEFKRKTADVDLSIGLVRNADAYEATCKALLDARYRQDKDRPYRYFPEKESPGALAYVDVLAHPATTDVSDQRARTAMGVGPNFSLTAMPFARKEAFSIEEKIFFPNPIGFIALKLHAYQDEPLKRIKDLADIAELVWGLVEKGTHFQLENLWTKIKSDQEAAFVRQALRELGGGTSVRWDLDSARDELATRSFSTTDLDDVIPERLIEIVEFLG